MSSSPLEMIKNLEPAELAYIPRGASIMITSPNPTNLPASPALKFVRHYPGFTTQLYSSLQQRLSTLSLPTPIPFFSPWSTYGDRFDTGSDRDVEGWFSFEVIKPVLSLATQVLPSPGLDLGVMHDPINANPSAFVLQEYHPPTGGAPSMIPILQFVYRFKNPNNRTTSGRDLLGQLQRLIETHENIEIPNIDQAESTGLPLDLMTRAEASRTDSLILPTYGAPGRVHIPKPLRLFLQQLWKEMALRDLYFAVVTEYDSTFYILRHREEQAFYISDKQGRTEKDPSLYCTILELTCRAYEDMDYRRGLGLNVDTRLVDVEPPTRPLERVAGQDAVPGKDYRGTGFRHIRLRLSGPEGGKAAHPLTLTPPDEIRFGPSSQVATLCRRFRPLLPSLPPTISLSPDLASLAGSEFTLESSPAHGNPSVFSSPRSRPPSGLFETMPPVNSWSSTYSGKSTFLKELDERVERDSSAEIQMRFTSRIQDNPSGEVWRGYLKIQPNFCAEVVAKIRRFDLLEQEHEVYRHMHARQLTGIPSLVGLYTEDDTVQKPSSEDDSTEEPGSEDDSTATEQPGTAYLLLSDEGDCYGESEVIGAKERESFRKILHAIHAAGILHNDLDRSNLLKYQKEGETVVAITGFHLAELMSGSKTDRDAMDLEETMFGELLGWS